MRSGKESRGGITVSRSLVRWKVLLVSCIVTEVCSGRTTSSNAATASAKRS